ncbi:hypothetical protein PHMEG_0008717 [Phytophthora megakarya]|uniref:Uncharacterized protein n=1 Tax=Phytophthora megakarya TaxID=4795 RepID=A0A225WJB5_9STRA|nr:hypothetical protein PHMEG_0008717 [Phytophthora megakarya]
MPSNAAFGVLTDYGLLQHITSFQAGLPYLVGQIDASLDCLTKLGSFRGKLPRFAIRQRDLQMLERLKTHDYKNYHKWSFTECVVVPLRDLQMLEVLLRASQNPRLQKLPQVEFYGVRRCAIEYNSLQVLKWLHATRDKSPTLSDESRLLGLAVTCYFDNVEIMEWLHSAPEGPHESIEAITEVELCRAAGFGNIRGIRWLHEQGCTAFSPLVMDTAATHGHLDLVTFLHDNRTEGCTTRAMHGAALNGYHQVVKYLAQNREEGPSDRTLEMAASAGHLCCVEAMCKFAQPPPRGSGAWRFAEAQQCAIDAGHHDVARFLARQRENEETGTKRKKRRCFGLF